MQKASTVNVVSISSVFKRRRCNNIVIVGKKIMMCFKHTVNIFSTSKKCTCHLLIATLRCVRVNQPVVSHGEIKTV